MKPDRYTRMLSIMAGEERSLSAGLSRAGLTVLMPAYGLAVAARNAAYDKRLLIGKTLPRTTISVGNITTGGTGKTPFVIEMAQSLVKTGIHPAVLLRGYKAGPTGSDEARLIAEELSSCGVHVEADADRANAAAIALAQFPDTDLFLLDDGFQHRQVHRDLDLVLVDATRPFGFGHLLPRGLLREPPQNLARADAVVITRSDQVSTDQIEKLDEQIEQLTGSPPIAHTAHSWFGYRDQNDNAFPIDHLSDTPVVGICGIANPTAFSRSMQQHSRRVVATESYPDHHDYQTADLRALIKRISGLHRPAALVTTAKDWVKWRHLLDPAEFPLPVYRPVIRITFLDDRTPFDQLLMGRCHRPNRDSNDASLS